MFALLLFISLTTSNKKQNERKKFIDENLKELRNIKHKCRSSQVSYLLWLIEYKSADVALFCALSVLNGVKGNVEEKSFAWVVLHQIYKQRKSKKHKFALKQSFYKNEKILLKNSWDFLGPFQIGKIELDGNPIESIGRKHAINNRWNAKYVAFSELVNDGILKWTTLTEDANKVLQLATNVNWNDLVMSLQSIGVAEWQGLLVNEFIIAEDNTEAKVQCLGVNVFYIDGRMMNGDIYHRSHYWYPIQLNSGIHQVEVPVRAKGSTSVRCDVITKKKEKGLMIHHVKFIPDLVDGNVFSNFISLDVTNMNSKGSIDILSAHAKNHNLKQEPVINIVKITKLLSGQTGSIVLKIAFNGDIIEKKCFREKYSMKIKIETDVNSQEVEVVLRCRSSHQSFLFTFLDHDGSIQHAATVKPLRDCELASCPVLLSLHGTGVKAENQADSYKRMRNGKYVFGVEKLWLLAPTRHGAHNWEGPGELTAMAALKELGILTKKASWLGKRANSDVVVFAGHSMGGHGAWQLSVHHPDKALAVISAAGWLSKENYGDSNLFYHHDVSVSHTDHMTKSIQESCIAENQADKHASNLKGIPVMIRIGANDRTVHPYFTRRMFRLLKEYRVNVTYKEFPNKEHWWWDTKTANDGGVTNDLQIRTFATYAVEKYEELYAFCDTHGCTQRKDKSKYTKQQGTRQEGRQEGRFEYVLYSPASFSGGRGVKVIQQKVPFRKTQYSVNIEDEQVMISTNNIQMLQLYEPIIEPVNWLHKKIVIDNNPLEMPSGDLPWKVCQHDKRWKTCQSSGNIREADAYGPARRVAEKPFIIVVCDDNKTGEVSILQNTATFLANLFHLTSDAVTHIFLSSELTNEQLQENNVIILGLSTCLDNINITQRVYFTDQNVDLGGCLLHGENLSALYLQPHADDKLMMILTGQNIESIRNGVMSLSIPTIPPMTRSPFSNLIPDYVVLSPDVLSKGAGGYVCAGFWSNSWTYNVVSSSCSC